MSRTRLARLRASPATHLAPPVPPALRLLLPLPCLFVCSPRLYAPNETQTPLLSLRPQFVACSFACVPPPCPQWPATARSAPHTSHHTLYVHRRMQVRLLMDLTVSGVHAQQYYSKWPFWRFVGMQDPAVVAFLLANLLIHVFRANWHLHGMHPTHLMRLFSHGYGLRSSICVVHP